MKHRIILSPTAFRGNDEFLDWLRQEGHSAEYGFYGRIGSFVDGRNTLRDVDSERILKKLIVDFSNRQMYSHIPPEARGFFASFMGRVA